MDRNLPTRCFEENFNLFYRDPEKYNLYKGLGYMAEMIALILQKVENLEQEIRRAR